MLAVSFHEIGHAMAMKKYGVKMKHISLFGFGPKVITWKSKFFDCTMGFGLIPFGAYVSPLNDLDDLPKYEREYIYMAGVRNNFFIALISIIMYSFLKEGPLKIMNLLIVSLLVYSLTFYKVQRFLILYILPILLIFLMYLTMIDSSFTDGYEKGFMTDGDFGKGFRSYGFWLTLFWVNILLGVTNMLPVMGLDGWQIFKNGYMDKVKDTFLALAWLVTLSIMPMIGDIKNVILWAIKLFN